MARESNDRRVRKTKALLRQGLTALLSEKGVKDITVTELAQRADMNRGTFYCHYKDIYDMVEQLEEEMFEEFSGVINAYDAERLRSGLRPILNDIFRFIERNADMCAALLRLDGDPSFFQRLKNAVYEKILREWGILYGLGEMPGGAYYLSFLVAGTIGMLQVWVGKKERESPEEMADMAERLILYGIQQWKA